ncbi:MAG: ATPase domain-containing protein [Candidatus Diapherotrites archaeon]|nr:hypothetical protein [Candidatus Micrarchaeota archaeon]MBU1939819.1 hypothetical protein [Candidatus Micrarchaeota archaeon]
MHWFVDNLYEVYREAERYLEKRAAGMPHHESLRQSPASGHGAKPSSDTVRPEPSDGQIIFSVKGGDKKFKKKGDGKYVEILPTDVHKFDDLIVDKGFERGSTVLISGGAGTGKTTFALQSLYHRANKGERGIFISFEEEPEKIMMHMKKNYGWDFEELRKKKLVDVIKFDPTKIARSVEESILSRTGALRIDFRQLELPFLPDRVVVDSLSALSIAFEDEEYYRKYIRLLFEALESLGSINFVITETEQDPEVYSRTGVEEFLADGVIVLYNMKVNRKRENALEILKLRSSKHEKRMVPYTITSKGIDISVNKRGD